MEDGSKDKAYEEWVAIATKICRIVTEPPMAGSPVSVPPDKVDAAKVLMFHFGRGFRTFTGLELLLREGYTQDGLVLSRVLLEVLFEMAFIAKHPNEATTYLEYGKDLEKEWKIKAQKYAPEFMHKALGATPNESKGKTKPKMRSSWHKQFRSVRQRGIEAGIPPIYYDLFYSLASRYIHGSGDWLRELTRPVPGGIHVSYTSDRSERNLVMMTACGCLVEMLFMLNGCLELNILETLKPLNKMYNELIASQSILLTDKYRE